MNKLRRANLIIPGIILFSLLFHLFGCFCLYDFTNDEGNWLINAKNYVLFGVFSLEGMYYTGFSPLNTFLHVLIFKAADPSIWIGRYVSIIFALASLLLFIWLVKRQCGLAVAVFAACLIAVNGIYNRGTTWAMLEPKVYFFGILALLCAFSSKKHIRMLTFLPMALGIGFKPHMVYLLLPISYVLLTAPRNAKIRTTLVFLSAALLIGGLFFYIAYTIDPDSFGLWWRLHLPYRLNHMLAFQLSRHMLQSVLYFLLRTPVTSFLFLIGVIAAIFRPKKTRFHKCLLLWIFAEIVFYIFQPYVPARYVLDLIFPLSIFAAEFLCGLKKTMAICIIVLIVFIQVASSMYFFLVVKPERPAIETAQFLQERQNLYDEILAPPQVSVGLKIKTISTSSYLSIKYALRNKLKRPPLCVLQKEAAITYALDDIFVKKYGRLIKKIGYFWIYRIQ
ncbi:MAG: hypothetical protein WBC74_02725 [Candidatus Omnitrophota bacterium]